MNKFLKKRANDAPPPIQSDVQSIVSTAPVSPGLKKPTGSRWKKSKKQPEPKPEVDISIALPSSDDFRTSLIMPNLSARFSMLREQDDPNSKLGKASDDSVLSPRRKSRLQDFGLGVNGLTDIAEVSSIADSFRPPFASNDRAGSFYSEDGYGSEADTSATGGVMARARPGEGNILFGGRQRIFKIPTGGLNASGLGKSVYVDDVSQSAFQRYRQKERGMTSGRDRGLSNASQDDVSALGQADGLRSGYELDTSFGGSGQDCADSPSMSVYDNKRSTSSTAHSDARSSTAATSITSPSVAASAISPPTSGATPMSTPAPNGALLERSNTKVRRLYEQGLDQHLQEQQTSAMTRLNSIQRQRNGKHGGPFLHSAKSTGNLQDRPAPVVTALHSQSSSIASNHVPSLAGTGLGKSARSNTSSPAPNSSHSPSEWAPDHDMLSQAIEPADRGKATAMGAFNKPAHAFDEQQYLERQKQLQRSNSNLARSNKIAAAPAAGPGIQQRIGRLEEAQRGRSQSPSRGQSPSSNRALDLPKGNAAMKASQFSAKSSDHTSTQSSGKASLPDTHRTFFGEISGSSDSEDDDQGPQIPDYSYGLHTGKWQPSVLPSVSEHPALRQQKSKASLLEDDEPLEPKPLRTTSSFKSLHEEPRDAAPAESRPPVPEIPHQPLNGMVHHLRQRSNQSSIYPTDEQPLDDEVPDLPPLQWTQKHYDWRNPTMDSTFDTDSKSGSVYTGSNPWDLEDAEFKSSTDQQRSQSSDSPTSRHRSATHDARRSEASAWTGYAESIRHSTESANRPPTREGGTNSPWQSDLYRQHTRDVSSGTQQERDAFSNELAARRNAIKENMKSIVESHSRGNSPARVPPSNTTGPFKAFGMLRSKDSGESLRNPRDLPTKSLKMLGLGSGNNSNSNLSHHNDGGPDLQRTTSSSRSTPAYGAKKQFDTDSTHERESLSRNDTENGRNARPPVPGPSVHAPSRSNSTATAGGRSRSRTGPYRDDLEKAMMEGTGSSVSSSVEFLPMLPRDFTPRPSPDIMSTHYETLSEESRGNYFDSKSPAPLQTNLPTRLNPPNTASAFSPASVHLARSPTDPHAYSPSNPTPPMSSSSTPLTSPYPPTTASARTSGRLMRKKTISKTDISEPTLISSTSRVDTVDLPEGASLKNGMDDPPPIPPINPRRRGTRKLFNMGRSESSDSVPLPDRSSDVSPDYGARSAHGSRSIHSSDFDSAPQYARSASSPERVPRATPAMPMNGAMF